MWFKKEDLMAKEKPKEIKKVELKYKVLSVADYYDKAISLFGDSNLWNDALALLYTENEVVAIVNKKGEEKFVVKI